MDILILGNGFDLAHELPTKYSDFLDYCENKFYNDVPDYKPKNVFFINMWIRHFINIQNQLGEKWIDLEEEIYRVLMHIKNLSIIKNSDNRRLFQLFFGDYNFNFYDINDYLIEPFKPIFSKNGYIRINPDDNVYYQIYFSASGDVINYLYDQLREFTKIFQEYLISEVLSKLDNVHKYQLSLKAIGVNKGDKDLHVLSFNYTDTCKRLYDQKFNTYCDINIKPVYVHGDVSSNEKCNLVLDTRSFDNEQLGIEFNVFKKHYQRHKYGTIEPYQDLLRKIKNSSSIPIFHIIGHSLDETDHNILKHVLLANTDSIINIYYHTQESLKRMQDNIDLIIGEEEVMTKVRFINQHDSERGILLPQESLQKSEIK